MKKRLSVRPLFLCIIVFAFLLSGCGKKEEVKTVASTYINLAQDFLEDEDYDSAVNILQKGLDVTGDDDIATLLQEAILLQMESQENTNEVIEAENQEPVDQPEPDNTFDPTPYLGLWAEADIGWQYGGMTLELSLDNGALVLYMQYIQSAPSSRVAEVYATLPLEECYGNTFWIDVGDDGWGNTATIEATLYEDCITVNVSNVTTKEGYSPMWGLYDGFFTLYRNDLAYEALFYTPEMYAEMSGNNARPDTYESEEPQVTYDTSTASGILESLGMTEDEFRANCSPLSHRSSSSKMVTTRDLREYPSAYIGQLFFLSSDYFFNKETGYFDPYNIEVSYKGTSSDGYTTYTVVPTDSRFEEHLLFFDMRDDIYAPTVSQGDYIYPYMIYIGVQTLSGTDYVCFQLISLDK